MPPVVGRLNAAGTTPTAAVLVTGAVIAGLALIGLGLVWQQAARRLFGRVEQ